MQLPTSRLQVYVAGHHPGLDEENFPGLVFDCDAPKTWCAICGTVFQTTYCRNPEGHANDPGFDGNVQLVKEYATALRKLWSKDHSKTHTEREHLQLIASGRMFTPEAAEKLHGFGILSLSDLALDEEVQSALSTAKPYPKDDSEDITNALRRIHL